MPDGANLVKSIQETLLVEIGERGCEYSMSEEYHIDYLAEPAWSEIGRGLHEYNLRHAGEGGDQLLCFALRAPDESIVGGIIGESHYGWLHIQILWVRDNLRGKGYGHQLLVAAEEEARKRGVKSVYLDTFSFQAPEFYKQHGYELYGTLEDFPPGFTRYYLTRKL
jgi:GNAT superfamily N-acetyltransferase